ncbi:hypothetical protein BDD12DRAFT_874274 [Trichophaea hybrida]|nr:hypothetical protein BDD12DRAFT_874274 [Trichophaea hybrida]
MGFSMLQLAVVIGSLPGMKLALRYAGSSIDHLDVNGNSALCLAAIKGRVRIMHLLLEANASLDIRSTDNSSILHRAVESEELGRSGYSIDVIGRIAVDQALLHHGALVEEVNNNEWTALKNSTMMTMNCLSPQFKSQDMSLFNDRLNISFQGIRSQEETSSLGLTCQLFTSGPGREPIFFGSIYIYALRSYLFGGSHEHREIRIGVEEFSNTYETMPSWMFFSRGYHGDNGKVYCGSGRGESRSWGETFGKGDIVGCGIGKRAGEIFFTKSGKYLGDELERQKDCVELAVENWSNSKNERVYSQESWDEGV